jgi:hypothetical protein
MERETLAETIRIADRAAAHAPIMPWGSGEGKLQAGCLES